MRRFILLFLLLIPLPALAQTHLPAIQINEIAWMGSTGSVYNEWIELKNNTFSEIPLEGWTLKSNDGKLSILLKGAIEGQGYFLLERNTSRSVLPPADLLYSGTLANTGMDLILYDGQENIIDQANFPTTWPAGDNATKQTMERATLNTWQTSSKTNGTPDQINSPGLQESPKNTALPNVKKSDNSNIETAAVVQPTSYKINSKNGINPVFLLVISFIIVIISGTILLIYQKNTNL